MLSRFEQFSFAISGISRYIQKIERDEMVKYGYKGAFAQYLIALNRFPEGITMTELCACCDKDKAAVSRIISEMVDKGLVLRQNEGVKVYNSRLLLTNEGKKAADFVLERGESAVELVSQLSESERKALYSALDSILSKLEVLAEEGLPSRNSD